jgi:hypothetical protein
MLHQGMDVMLGLVAPEIGEQMGEATQVFLDLGLGDSRDLLRLGFLLDLRGLQALLLDCQLLDAVPCGLACGVGIRLVVPPIPDADCASRPASVVGV